MSRWGEENFDNDLASEILISIVLQLVERIKTCLTGGDYDPLFCGEIELMPGVDILLTLSKAYPDMVIPILKEEPITEWKDKYLDIFEQNSEVPMDNKFQSERRSVIFRTFTDLEELINNYI